MAEWMNQLAVQDRPGDPLPDPVLIWWKARLLERQAAPARAARPVMIAQWGSVAVAVITSVLLWVLNWTGITGLVGAAGAALWFAAGAALVAMAVALRFAIEK